MNRNFYYLLAIIALLFAGCDKPLEPLEYGILISRFPGGDMKVRATIKGVPVTEAAKGAEVTLTAEPGEFHTFRQWKGDVDFKATDDPAIVTFTMPANYVHVEAWFNRNKYSITIKDAVNGSAEAIIDDELITEKTFEVAWSHDIMLTPKPGHGYMFKQWVSDDISPANPKADPLKFSMPKHNVEITAEFHNSVMIGDVVWAVCNVDAPGTFAAKHTDAGMYYQWNRKKGWSATGDVTGWDDSNEQGRSWAAENDPCPAGWRVPTYEEFKSLFAHSLLQSDWVDGTENTLAGRRFVDKTSGNMVFLPASGRRDEIDGRLGSVGIDGSYWSELSFGRDIGYSYGFSANSIRYGSYSDRSAGFSVRCVAK